MQLAHYLERIDWSGETGPTLDVLAALLQAHNHRVPFENLDVQLGRPVTTGADEAWQKLVMGGRGGWCYEQNGVFGAVLEKIGFDVQRVSASVERLIRGPISEANHLTLIVGVPGERDRWLVDVGFGGSLIRPIPLREASHDHAPYRVGLRKLDDGFWQFWESTGGDEFTFDFEDVPADEDAMSARCDYLQTDPDSGFVQNLVCQIRRPSSHVILRGRVLTVVASDGKHEQLVETVDEWVHTVRNEFGLDVPELADLWGRVCERHEQLSKST